MNDLPSMTGKTCLVTGATSGIGAVTAEALARAGAEVVLVGRDRAKTEAAVDRLRRETRNPAVSSLLADLSSQAEIRRLADEFRATHPRLDVLVNNAGAMFSPRRESVDGIEMTWALNHLAYFLLTDLLREPLVAAGRARVVNVSSQAHRMVSGINFDDPEGKRSYKPFRLYGQSKLANILFTNELARRLAGTGVTANSLHPGFVFTNFFANSGLLGQAMKLLGRAIAIAPEAGARTTIYLATAPEVAEITGRYFDKQKVATPSAAALDEAAARRLWELSARMTGVQEK